MKDYVFSANFSSMEEAVHSLCKVSKSFNDMISHANFLRDEAVTETLENSENNLLVNVPISLNDILGQKIFQHKHYHRKIVFMFYEFVKKYNEFAEINNDITITEEEGKLITLIYTTFSSKNTYIFNIHSLYQSDFNDIFIETIWKCKSEQGTCLESVKNHDKFKVKEEDN